MEIRKAKLLVTKGGSGSSTFRATLPTNWIRKMGLSEDVKDLELIFDGEMITIKKENAIMFKMDKRKKAEVIDINKDYRNANDALIDTGYENIGDCDIQYKDKEIRKDVYKKDEKYYYYVGMEHDNTYIYNVSIRELIEV